jgi:cytoskeletal protein RodZ
MRARTALRVVALVSTLAGPMALPSVAAAATPKKTAAKSSSKKSSSSKSSASKSSSKGKSKSTTTAKAASAKASTSSSGSSVKAAFDPVAPSTSIPAAPATASVGGAPPQRGPTRIDFDDRLIQGQTNKSGAVYLYDRKELKQRSMIKKRETFREEIVGAVYDSEL